MKKKITIIAIKLILRLNGWKPCELFDGSPGWAKHNGSYILKGSLKYATSKLLT